MDSKNRDHSTPLSDYYLREHTVGKLRPLSGPIRIVDYDPAWPQMFEREAQRISNALAGRALQIEHVGSTSVPELPAKPIIDIALVVADSSNEPLYVPDLETAGYRLHLREPGWFEHRLFKGPDGSDGSANLHVFSSRCPEIERMVKFRNWLRVNKGDRDLYGRTKRALAEREWKYTQNYADAKSEVIEEIMSRARQAATERENA